LGRHRFAIHKPPEPVEPSAQIGHPEPNVGQVGPVGAQLPTNLAQLDPQRPVDLGQRLGPAILKHGKKTRSGEHKYENTDADSRLPGAPAHLKSIVGEKRTRGRSRRGIIADNA
jgi:hypothetical protein